MEIMTKLLEENHIALPEFAKRWERKQGNGKHEHALSAWVKTISVFSIFDIFFLDSPFYISGPESSIPSLEETPSSSPKFPPETSHF